MRGRFVSLKFKGHADEEMVRGGKVSELDRVGNNRADEAADWGRLGTCGDEREMCNLKVNHAYLMNMLGGEDNAGDGQGYQPPVPTAEEEDAKVLVMRTAPREPIRQ